MNGCYSDGSVESGRWAEGKGNGLLRVFGVETELVDTPYGRK